MSLWTRVVCIITPTVRKRQPLPLFCNHYYRSNDGPAMELRNKVRYGYNENNGKSGMEIPELKEHSEWMLSV